MSRIGDKIDQIGVSDSFYGLVLGDNSVRVIRSDNNRCVVESKAAVLPTTGVSESEHGCDLGACSNLVLAPTADSI